MTAFHRLAKKVFFSRYQRPWRWPDGVEAGAWEPVTFASSSGARLAALFGPAYGTAVGAVVLAHPMTVAAKGFWLKQGHTELLRRHGFDVLAFDFNGFGESESGNFDYPADVLAAAEYLCQRQPSAPITAVGASFGAGYVLCALANANHRFSGVVLEAAFPSLPYFWRRYPVPSAMLRLSQLLYPKMERNLRPMLAAANLKGKPRVLLIHGEADTISPVIVGEQLKAQMEENGTAELWVVPEAEHSLAFAAAPDLYAQRVVAFLRSSVAPA